MAQEPYKDSVNTGIGTFLFNSCSKNDLHISPVLIGIFKFCKKIIMDTPLANILSKFGGYMFMGDLGKNSWVSCGYFTKESSLLTKNFFKHSFFVQNNLHISLVLIKIIKFGKKILMDTSLANIVSKFEGYIFMGGLGKNSSVTCGYFAKVWRNSQSKVNFPSQNIHKLLNI